MAKTVYNYKMQECKIPSTYTLTKEHDFMHLNMNKHIRFQWKVSLAGPVVHTLEPTAHTQRTGRTANHATM